MDYQALVQRLRARISDRRRGFQPSRFERQIYTDAATAITDLLAQRKVLVEEVETGRKMLTINAKTGRAYWCDFFNDGHLAYKDARAATDAAFPGGLPK